MYKTIIMHIKPHITIGIFSILYNITYLIIIVWIYYILVTRNLIKQYYFIFLCIMYIQCICTHQYEYKI